MLFGSIGNLLVVSLVFFSAGAVKGILGMGLPTVVMGLLGLVMPVAGAAALLTVPSFVTNVWQAAIGPSLRAALVRFGPMQLAIVAGILATPLLFPGPHDQLGRKLLGACLAAYGVLGLLGKHLPKPPQRREGLLNVLVGASSGVLTGLTGLFVLPAVPYLQSLGLGKDALAQAFGLCFTTSTVALGLMLALQGHLDLRTSLAALLMVLPAVAGMLFGQRVRGRMSEAAFRKCFFVGLVVLGGWLLAA